MTNKFSAKTSPAPRRERSDSVSSPTDMEAPVLRRPASAAARAKVLFQYLEDSKENIDPSHGLLVEPMRARRRRTCGRGRLAVSCGGAAAATDGAGDDDVKMTPLRELYSAEAFTLDVENDDTTALPTRRRGFQSLR